MLFHSLPPQWHYLLLITLVDHHVRVDYPRTVRASTHWRLVVCALDVRERIKMSTLAGGQIVCWVIIRCKLEKDLASYFSVPLVVTAHKYAGLGQGHSTSVIQPHSNTQKKWREQLFTQHKMHEMLYFRWCLRTDKYGSLEHLLCMFIKCTRKTHVQTRSSVEQQKNNTHTHNPPLHESVRVSARSQWFMLCRYLWRCVRCALWTAKLTPTNACKTINTPTTTKKKLTKLNLQSLLFRSTSLRDVSPSRLIQIVCRESLTFLSIIFQ